jgi:hypothetical protein
MTLAPLASGFAEAGGLLCILFAVTNSYLGEKYALRRFFAAGAFPRGPGADFTRTTARFAWHGFSLAWLAFGVLLVGTTSGVFSARTVLGMIAGAAFLSAILAAAFTRGRNPAWGLFAVVGILAAVAAAQAT